MAEMIKPKCPECRSTKLICAGSQWTSDHKAPGKHGKLKRVKLQRFQCKNCGRFTGFPIGYLEGVLYE